MATIGKSPPPLKIVLDSKSDPYPKSSHWNDTERRLWTVLLFIMTAMLFSARTIVPLVAVNMSEEFGWDKADTGLVLGSFFWGYPIAQIPGGMMSDHIGGDYVIIRAAFIWGVVTVVTPMMPYYFTTKAGTIACMTFLRFLMGLTQGVHYPSLTSLLSQKVAADKRAYVLSCVFAASSLGTLLTGAIGSIIEEHSNWHYVFFFFGSASLMVAMVINSFSKKQRRKTFFSFQNGRAGTRKEEEERKALPILKLITKKPFWATTISHLMVIFAYYIVLNWMPTFFKEVYPESKGWVYNVLPWLAAIPASVAGGCMGDTLIAYKVPVGISRKIMHLLAMGGMASCLFALSKAESFQASQALFLAMGGMASCLFALPMAESFQASLLLMVLAIMSENLVNASIPPNVQDIAPNHAGAVFGIINTLGAVQGFAGTYIAGWILHSTNSWAAVFNMSGGVCVMSGIIFIIFAVGTPVI